MTPGTRTGRPGDTGGLRRPRPGGYAALAHLVRGIAAEELATQPLRSEPAGVRGGGDAVPAAAPRHAASRRGAAPAARAGSACPRPTANGARRASSARPLQAHATWQRRRSLPLLRRLLRPAARGVRRGRHAQARGARGTCAGAAPVTGQAAATAAAAPAEASRAPSPLPPSTAMVSRLAGSPRSPRRRSGSCVASSNAGITNEIMCRPPLLLGIPRLEHAAAGVGSAAPAPPGAGA